MYEEIHGAMMMANAQQPSRRTSHMDIKHLSLLDWVQCNLTILQCISTHDNASEDMTQNITKATFLSTHGYLNEFNHMFPKR